MSFLCEAMYVYEAKYQIISLHAFYIYCKKASELIMQYIHILVHWVKCNIYKVETCMYIIKSKSERYCRSRKVHCEKSTIEQNSEVLIL